MVRLLVMVVLVVNHPYHKDGKLIMAESTIISWNPANWITVVLIVAISFFIIGAITRIYQQKKKGA